MPAASESLREQEFGGALRGLRVVDASMQIGAYCSKLLADYGADVIKVEPPDGDMLRRRPPFKGHVPSVEGSLSFAYYHGNKRGVTLDRTRSEAEPAWRRLIATAAVVLYESPNISELDLAHPQQVVCTVTPYGVDGPYRDMPATHLTSSAMGGSFVAPRPGSAPAPVPDLQMYDGVGAHAALAIMVALRNRSAVGGQFIDISAHEVLSAKNMAVQRFMQAGHDQLPTPGDVAPPAGTWSCEDGPVELLVFHSGQWDAFRQLMGDPPEFEDPALRDSHVRRERAQLIRAVTGPILAGMSKVEVFEKAQALRIPCAPVNKLIEFVNDPQTVNRGTFAEEIEHPKVGRYPVQRTHRATAPITVVRRPAPLLGEHNQEIFVDELEFSSGELDAWRREGVV